MNEIARSASVGVGTLYRHFPTKEALLAEVLRARLADLLVVSRGIVERTGEDADPGELLFAWARAVSAHISQFTAVHEWVIAALTDDPELRELHQQVLDEGQALLTRAQEAGCAASRVEIAELMMAIAALTVTAVKDDPDRPLRLLSLLFAGVLT